MKVVKISVTDYRAAMRPYQEQTVMNFELMLLVLGGLEQGCSVTNWSF